MRYAPFVAVPVIALSLLGPLQDVAWAAPAAPATPIGNYLQKGSAKVTVSGGTQLLKDLYCPRGTTVTGGGALLPSNRLDDSLNTSAPVSDGRRWRVRVNDAGTASTEFRSFAICATGLQQDSVVEGIGVDNPPGTRTTATATCPVGTVPLGGGGAPTSPSPLVSTVSSTPVDNGWQVTVDNQGRDSDFVIPYAVCAAAPDGYSQVVGVPSLIKSHSQGQAAVSCPTGTVVLSGGSRSAAPVSGVVLNSSYPTDTSTWQVSQTNPHATRKATIQAVAVCVSAGA